MNFVKAQLEKAERFVENVEQKVAERVRTNTPRDKKKSLVDFN